LGISELEDSLVGTDDLLENEVNDEDLKEGEIIYYPKVTIL
jgi:hypothetical protein